MSVAGEVKGVGDGGSWLARSVAGSILALALHACHAHGVTLTFKSSLVTHDNGVLLMPPKNKLQPTLPPLECACHHVLLVCLSAVAGQGLVGC